MGSDDDLLGGVRVMVEMRRSLRPTRMTRMHLEPASIERDKVIHLMQLTDLDAELFREVEIVGRQLVLGVVAAADVAVPHGSQSFSVLQPSSSHTPLETSTAAARLAIASADRQHISSPAGHPSPPQGQCFCHTLNNICSSSFETSTTRYKTVSSITTKTEDHSGCKSSEGRSTRRHDVFGAGIDRCAAQQEGNHWPALWWDAFAVRSH